MDKQWIDFKPEHARDILSGRVRDQEAWCDADSSDDWCASLAGRIWAYTLIVDGAPVACVGLVLQPWDKAEAWALLSNAYKSHKLEIYRFIREKLAMAFGQGIVRVQATIDPSYPANIKWIESLGFECEGRLKKYGPHREDYLLYSRTN